MRENQIRLLLEGSLIGVYTVCNIFDILKHCLVMKPLCSNFSEKKANVTLSKKKRLMVPKKRLLLISKFNCLFMNVHVRQCLLLIMYILKNDEMCYRVIIVPKKFHIEY